MQGVTATFDISYVSVGRYWKTLGYMNFSSIYIPHDLTDKN